MARIESDRATGGGRAAGPALAFAVALFVFMVSPPLLTGDFPPYRLVRYADILDIVSPVVVIPLAWLLYRRAAQDPVSTLGSFLFVALAATWIEGQGMHLAANAIDNLIPKGSPGDVASLTENLDEWVGHYVWHAGIIGMSALIGLRALRARPVAVSGGALAIIAVAALLYGFTFFAAVVEGNTYGIGIPAAVVLSVGGLLAGRQSLVSRPVALMFVAAYLLAILLGLAWAGLNDWTLRPFCDTSLC